MNYSRKQPVQSVMPKKRRKLSKELEGEISIAFKKVELITAIINDIQEEDIQNEFRTAFDSVRNTYLLLTTLYDSRGITEETEDLLKNYKILLQKFEEEYEI